MDKPNCWVKKMQFINLSQQLGLSIFDLQLGKKITQQFLECNNAGLF